MYMLILGAATALPLFVIGHTISAGYFLYLAFEGLPVGWALGLALWSLFFMANGYKTMIATNERQDMMRATNVLAAASLALFALLATPLWFVRSGAVSTFTAWWAVLLLPLAFIAYLAMFIGMAVVLDAINPRGRNQ